MRHLAWIVALAAGLALVYGPAHAGYDAAWALLWGDQIASGSAPEFRGPVAPTPHPLANLVAALFAPFGSHAAAVLTAAVSWLSLAALGTAVFTLGRELFGTAAGALAAVVILTRPLMVLEAQQSIVDVPFLALVTAALVLEARRHEDDLRIPVLLAAAGLLRPEAWLIAAAWWLWYARGSSLRGAVRSAAVLAVAPVGWALGDLASTGDPLWSLHGTQDLASELERPRSIAAALVAAPDGLRHTLLDPVVWIGFAGAAATLLWLARRAALPAAAAGFGLLTFLAFGAAGLPVLTRYLLLPALMLAVFAGAAVFGWRRLPEGHPARRPWAITGGVLAVVLVAMAPAQAQKLVDARDFGRERASVQSDLEELVALPAVRRAAQGCPVVWIPDHRLRPVVAVGLSRRAESVPALPAAQAPRSGLYVNYANRDAARAYAVRTEEPRMWPGTLPPGTRRVTANESWVVGARCPR